MRSNGKKRTVLLLEDEPVICKIIARTLEPDGLKVDIAQNGLIAKEKIEAGNKYDLFIFDIRTPIETGIQVFEYIEQKHPEMIDKVVFTTGDCLNTATGSFLEKANRPYLPKPYTPAQLRSLIREVLPLEAIPKF